MHSHCPGFARVRRAVVRVIQETGCPDVMFGECSVSSRGSEN